MSTSRLEDLSSLKNYLDQCNNDITMILQSLQWDRKELFSKEVMVTCSHNAGHLMPADKRQEHEYKCLLNSQGYSKEDRLLPEPLDSNANTIVKLDSESIKQIIEDASKNDPSFKRGNSRDGQVPLTLERLQSTYTADERRAIYDAVVALVPSSQDLSNLALTDPTSEKKERVIKSHVEVLAELRNMKRRRTKYRVAAKTKKYSDVLRDVIKMQVHFKLVPSGIHRHFEPKANNAYFNMLLSTMELYTDVQLKKDDSELDDKSDRNSEFNKERRRDNTERHTNYRENYEELNKIPHSSSVRSRNSHKTEKNTERSRSRHVLTEGKLKRNGENDTKYDRRNDVGGPSSENRRNENKNVCSDNYKRQDTSERSSRRDKDEKRERHTSRSHIERHRRHYSDKHHRKYESSRREDKDHRRGDTVKIKQERDEYRKYEPRRTDDWGHRFDEVRIKKERNKS